MVSTAKLVQKERVNKRNAMYMHATHANSRLGVRFGVRVLVLDLLGDVVKSIECAAVVLVAVLLELGLVVVPV